jgi:hypothetical protein
MKNTRLITGMVWLLLTAGEYGCAQGLEEAFRDPGSQNGTVTLYWLNGTIEMDTLSEHLRLLQENGFRGISPLPLSKRRFPTRPSYLSEDYFRMYGRMLEGLADRGMELVLYDDCDFPSGTAGGEMKRLYPGDMLKYLVRMDTLVSGGGTVSLDVPEGKLMSALVSEAAGDEGKGEAGEVITGRVRLSPEGGGGTALLDLPGSGAWRVQLFFCVIDKRYPTVDLLDPEAIRRLTSLTYDRYYERFREYFGSTIRKSFYDDIAYFLAPGFRLWTNDFNTKFEERYGYSPEGLYPALFEETGEETEASRVALFGFRNDLFLEAYPKVVSEWARAHGIRCAGHPGGTYRPNPLQCQGDGVKYYKYQDIPLTDYIHAFRHGIDGFKIPASGAWNYDREQLICEIYGNFSPDRNNDMNMLYRAGMDMYARGINALLPHGTWYDDRKVDIVPEISWRNPAYEGKLRGYNQWAGRCEMLLQQSGHVAGIAVLYPIADLESRYDFVNYAATNGREPVHGNGYYPVLKMLTSGVRTDYTLLHPEVLDERCTVVGNTLKMDSRLNSEQYRVLFLPYCRTMHLSNLQKIQTFASRGGIVVALGDLPEKSAERGKDAALQALVKEMIADSSLLFLREPSSGKLTELLDRTFPERELRITDVKPLWPLSPSRTAATPPEFLDTDYCYNYIHKSKEGKEIFFFPNTTDYTLTARLSFCETIGTCPARWDPHSGEITPLEMEKKDGRLLFDLQLQPVSSCFIVFESIR